MTDTQKDLEINKENLSENTAHELSDTPQTPDTNSGNKKKKAVLIMAIIAVSLAGAAAFAVLFGIPYLKYNSAVSMMEAEEYKKAMTTFNELNGFMDSKEMYNECQYQNAVSLCEAGKFSDAIAIFEDLGDYKDCNDLITNCRYQSATLMIEEDRYDEAVTIFEQLGDYKDSKDKINECNYLKACGMLKNSDYAQSQSIFEALGSYKDSEDQVKECKYQNALKQIDDGEIVKAYKTLTSLGSYKKSKQKASSIQTAYIRILAKDNIFINKMWIPPTGLRCQIISSVIDENTMEFKYKGSASLMEHTEETIIATWDETNGTLTYSGSTRFLNNSVGLQSVLYTDGSGYFYYENGYLYFVNNKSEPGYNTTYFE